MSGIVFAIPGDIDAPTGGYGYDRRLLREWREAGIEARHLALPGSFPFPTKADLAATEQLLAATGAGDLLLVDGHTCESAFVLLEPKQRSGVVEHHRMHHGNHRASRG